MQQKNIYIILTRTSTVLSRLISQITGDTYTHASIAFDKDLTSIFSFGRKRKRNPFIGGFCHENLNEGVFADCKELPYAIIQVNATPEQYDSAYSINQECNQNADKYHYNFIGLLFAWIGKAHKRDNSFYCSEYVFDVLRRCEIIREEMAPVIRPQELMRYGQIIELGDWKLDHKMKQTDEAVYRRSCLQSLCDARTYLRA